MSEMRRRIRRLSSQILLAHVAILVVSLGVGSALFVHTVRNNLDDEFQARAASIAQTFAVIPAVKSCLASPNAACDDEMQRLATAAAHNAGAAYVVLIDTAGIRHSHPDPALIGQKVSEPLVARDGRVHLGVDSGSTGTTANARVPLFGPTDAFAGEVSVGIRESSVSGELLRELPSYAAWLAVVLALGTVASFGLASHLKRRTFGLELDEIAHLLQEREATLHGIREGVIALDPGGRISVLNDQAQRLLRLPADGPGRRLEDLVPPGPLRDALAGTTSEIDEIVVTDDHCLVINRMPVTLSGRAHGAVVTLRDRTDVEGLARELAGERSLTESMRAQQHEFANRLHVISGLLELDEPEAALSYVREIKGTSADLDETLRRHIRAPQIVGLLLGKTAEAAERSIELRLDPETTLGESPTHVQVLITILGNLIDNAVDALRSAPTPRVIEVSVVEDTETLRIRVSDNGPGVPSAIGPRVFHQGFSTKRSSGDGHHGLGLSLVQNTATKLGGTVSVSTGRGATFTVDIPLSPATNGALT